MPPTLGSLGVEQAVLLNNRHLTVIANDVTDINEVKSEYLKYSGKADGEASKISLQ